MDVSQATREVYWNIPYHGALYLFLVPTLVIMGWGLWKRVRIWRTGAPAMRFDRIGERLDMFAANVVLQARTVRNRYAAFFHTGLILGFLVLLAATTVVAIYEYSEKLAVQIPIMEGWFYLLFQSLIVDAFGLWVVIGVGLAMARRFVQKPAKLIYTSEANIILWLIFAIAVTGFLVEGWRIAVTDDPWGLWSPVGWLTAQASDAFLSDSAMKTLHRGTWWFHMLVSFGFLAYAPYTKMAHVLTSPLNIFTANLDGPGGALEVIDFEKAPVLGFNSLEQLSWKGLLDLDACTECGRCTAVCPANTVGKELSPRDVIVDLRTLMHQSSETLLALGGNDTNGDGEAASTDGAPAAAIPVLREDHAVRAETMFQCTTCAACMEACPVFIEHIPKIVGTRRYMVMEEAEFPEGMMAAVTSLESRKHPFPGTQFSRTDWAEGLEIPVLSEMDNPSEAEVLFWVGCGPALVERNHGSVQATAKLLQEAGVKFAILGREEHCNGDPARRIGNEFLFEMLANENVSTLGKYGVKQIVTSCPHCFNTFKNEYPDFGGDYQVHHHSEFLAALLDDGKLTRKRRTSREVTFHDPCYLGRHNGRYNEPRRVLEQSARHRVEMGRSGSKSFCCGGGGGMMFVDEPPDQRVNQERAEEALATGADVVAVGCPFCATMLDDGVAARKGDREMAVVDIAELLLDAVEGGA